jgi:DNA-binding NarL/FixJ family response regulator
MTTALHAPQADRAGRLRVVPPDDGIEAPTQQRLPPAGRPLEELRLRVRAARIALIRFDRDAAEFEIVAAAGNPFLATGARLPIAASTIVVAASEGRRSFLVPEHSSRPLDRIAAGLGLRYALGVPITIARTPVGAVTALWDADHPAVADPCSALNGDHVELVRMLVAPEPAQPRVLVCHEDALVAEGLAHIAERSLGATTAIACTLDSVLVVLSGEAPDLIVLSDHLAPNELPPRTARRLRAAGAAAPMLVLTHNNSRQSFEYALQAGASGYLPAAAAAERLPDVATALLEGRSALLQPQTTPTVPRLTEREHQVLLGFEQGLADKQIALELGVAVSTVKTHARSIYAKLEATSRTSALHRARLSGLV